MRKVIKLEDVCEILDSQRIPITAKDRKKGIYPYYGANGIQDYVDGYLFDEELVLVAEDGGNFGSDERPIAYRVSGKCWVNNHAHVLRPRKDINVDYLCYSLAFYDTSSIVNGATRQKLTQRQMRNMQIQLLDMEEQLRIVHHMKSVQSLLSHYKQQLELLDTLVKARFVEMFGDPVLNDKGWEERPLSDIAEYRNGLTYRPEDVSEIGTIVLRSSNIQNGRLDFSDIVRVNCPIGDNKLVKQNDILMCSRNGSARLVGKVASITEIDEPMAFGAFMMIIRSPYHSYLLSYFQTEGFRNQIRTGATTTINQITANMLSRVKVPIPPTSLQSQFDDFVQQVEKTKADVQKSLDKTQMLFDSLMQEYFG